MRLSKPLLPVDYVTQVEAHPAMRGFISAVYDKEAHEARLGMRDWHKPLTPNITFAIVDDPGIGFTTQAQRTRLHFAAFTGDVLALSEIIGAGATVNKADDYGVTPLNLTFMEISKAKSPACVLVDLNGNIRSPSDRKQFIQRLTWCARILIEQHAVVDVSVDGQSLLDLACSWGDWDTITLLLKHGAPVSPSNSSRLRISSDRRRFANLVQLYPPSTTRPSRICPCWSGKVVSECHGAKAQPYPDHYICVCGSGKTYGKCCHARGALVLERWDPSAKRILHDYDRSSAIPFALHDEYKDFMALHDVMAIEGEKLGIKSKSPDVGRSLAKYAAELLSKGLIDPAFAYGVEKLGMVPQPHKKTTSHHIRAATQIAWNGAVDEYIASGKDSRKKEEVERAAKISSGNGALYKTCEAPGCSVYGTTDRKLSACGRCGTSVYCSRNCQRSAWPSHKVICGTEEQLEQSLPSQTSVRSSTEVHAQQLKAELGQFLADSKVFLPELCELSRGVASDFFK